MQIGMIGLGRMGSNRVRRLVREGHRYVVYDRHGEAAQALQSQGASGGGAGLERGCRPMIGGEKDAVRHFDPVFGTLAPGVGTAVPTPGRDQPDTMPEKTQLAFAEHGDLKSALPADGGEADEFLAAFSWAGVDDEALAATLQREGTLSFAKSWNGLIDRIASKSAALAKPDASGGGQTMTNATHSPRCASIHL